MNVGDLLNRLQEFGDRPAIVWRGQTCSYGALLRRVAAWTQVLAAEQIRPGAGVAFCGDFSPATAALLLALAAHGNVAIPLTRSVLSPRERARRSIFASTLFDFDGDDHWQVRSCGVPADHPLLQQLRDRGEAGLVLFSSGSTGDAKAALLSLPRLLTRFEKRGRAFRMVTFLLLDHMGGVNTLLSILGNGGTAVTVAERSVDAVCQAIQDYHVDLLPATPTFLNMLLISEAPRRYDLSSLQFISYGTEPMPATTLEAMQTAFPGVRLRQLYGLTELGILPTKTHPHDPLRIKLEQDGCEVRIVDGILWVRAATAMLGYLNAPSPFAADGWLNTGDAVVEEDGYLRILGRASELINVGGEKVFPVEVEDIILEVANVRDVVVWGKANAITGQVVAARLLLAQPEPAAEVERRVRRHCRQRLAAFKVPAVVEIVQNDLHNGRFKRVRRLAAADSEAVPTT